MAELYPRLSASEETEPWGWGVIDMAMWKPRRCPRWGGVISFLTEIWMAGMSSVSSAHVAMS